jgi:MoxR-like ATPase
MIEQRTEQFRKTFSDIKNQIAQVIVGLDEIVDAVIGALFLGGHVLLEGVPGLGKTLLVKSLADSLNLSFSRIQFTPDLMPADILGTNLIIESMPGQKAFQFQKGPIFTNILLADEINRATPKTQSALLEAMQERTVTVAGQQNALTEPFYVLATQNPIEMEGTYPLPEAQLDRFLYKLIVPFPDEEQLLKIVHRTTNEVPVRAQAVAERDRIREFSQLILQVPVAENVARVAGRIVMQTHPEFDGSPENIRRFVRYGSSPRGAQALILSAKLRALQQGRFNAAMEDVLGAASICLRHRIILNIEGQAENISADQLIDDVVASAQAQLRSES